MLMRPKPYVLAHDLPVWVSSTCMPRADFSAAAAKRLRLQTHQHRLNQPHAGEGSNQRLLRKRAGWRTDRGAALNDVLLVADAVQRWFEVLIRALS
jgi:hypothetical protein